MRHPTGGGLVPHDTDWTYSLVFPPGHFWYPFKAAESYLRVHQWLRDAFAQMDVPATLSPLRQKEIPGQCFVGAEKDDLLWHGRKIAGAAQRRTRNGLLIQGSVQPPPIQLLRKRWETAMCQAGNIWGLNGKRWNRDRNCKILLKAFGPRNTDGRISMKSDKLLEFGERLAGIDDLRRPFPARGQ